MQKAFYLPEAHTDMISAVIGEELGMVGILGVVGLFAMFGYAGLRVAQKAKDNYGKLLVAGLTSLVLVTGDDQPLRGDGPGAADRRAAAVRLLRQQQPAGDPVRGRADPQRRPRRHRARRGHGRLAGKLRVVEGGRSPARERSRSSGARKAKSGGGGGGNRGPRRAGDGGRRRASG